MGLTGAYDRFHVFRTVDPTAMADDPVPGPARVSVAVNTRPSAADRNCSVTVEPDLGEHMREVQG